MDMWEPLENSNKTIIKFTFVRASSLIMMLLFFDAL